MPAATPARRGTRQATSQRRGARPQARTAKKEREEPTALEADPVEIVVESLSSFNESKNILIYGPSGQGKTVLAGGAPNSIFLSTEKGVVAAKRAGSKAELIRAPDWEHALSGVVWADKNMGPSDWLIVDSHTKMQVLYLRWLLRTHHELNSRRDLDIPAIQDHQKWQNAFMRWTDHIVDAKYNSIFICTSMVTEDQEGETLVLPSIRGKGYEISNYISAQMDVILYYAVSERASTEDMTVRRALAQPYPPYLAKDRYNALGKRWDVMEEDYTAMAQIIRAIEKVA